MIAGRSTLGAEAFDELVGARPARASSAVAQNDFDIGPSGPQELLKRVLDLLLAVLLLAVSLPLAALIAVLVKLTSAGPVLFRQTRVGWHENEFQILKFRTMIHEADRLRDRLAMESEADGLFKMRGDPRMTAVGRVLRRSYLDELPQLLNVLRGEMSIVGPRPLIPDEDVAITGSGRRRLQMRPGITGDWQLLRGGGSSLDELIATDFRYVTGWSLWSDARCLVKTVGFMLGMRGW
ncbi:MAG: sugar transferase [Solirubrobacteraceae bacterium]